jgi:5-methylcytosine-specific restriction endonuclease McrA
MKSEQKTRSLSSLAAAYASKELRVKPEYQRGTVWKLPQKQGLIDSLLRGYQIPLFYVHLEQRPNNYTGEVETTAWLVDGQQRLAAIFGFLEGEFALPDPQKAKPSSVLPPSMAVVPSWAGKKIDELDANDRQRLQARELLVIEMIADDPNEVRDLFIRLQAGTPLTAQEKRDAWPGEFTNFVIRHAGKAGHSLSHPKPFFTVCQKNRILSVDDGAHYVDGLAETRKFFAGLAMTIMVRARAGVDFVDLKGTTINDFYIANLVLDEEDPAAARVLQVLDTSAQLPDWERLKTGRALSYQWAFHFALLVDALLQGNFTPGWRGEVVKAFLDFKGRVAEAQLHYRQHRDSLPHHERFGRLLSGSGSDTADIIRIRHAFLLGEVYQKMQLRPLDPHRLFDPLEKEVIWNRDRGMCQCPSCDRVDKIVSFAEATVHHVVEHSSGGQTVLENGVLVCPQCHGNRYEMQKLEGHFKAYLSRICAPRPPGQVQLLSAEPMIPDSEESPANRLRIVVDWPALDVDREKQIIEEPLGSQTVVRLLEELIKVFGDSMATQLQELPVIRYPLSKNPAVSFLNPSTGRPFSSLKIPGSGLHFCAISSTQEKVRRLKELVERLVLPDERGFPDGSVEVAMLPKP